jgi:hypothetical protein
MDPVYLAQLISELNSEQPTQAETVAVTPEDLVPGCVIASGAWKGHVVTSTPQPLSGKTVQAPIRYLLGGHNVTRRLSRSEKVTVYRARLDPQHLRNVPTVPRCFVPADPTPGDRVVQSFHDSLTLGTNRFFTYTGSEWNQVVDTHSNGRWSTTLAQHADITRLVSHPGEASPGGWFHYLPTGQRPYLYVDGMPMPARTVDQLVVGDVIRTPRYARLRVVGLDRAPDMTEVAFRVERPSAVRLRYFIWGRTQGAYATQHDSGRTGTLYATEPRPDELVPASELEPLDTAITAWGTERSAVVTVDDVWRQPVSTAMHVHSTGVDGRQRRDLTALEPRYVLLYRPHAAHRFAPAETIVPVRSHA